VTSIRGHQMRLLIAGVIGLYVACSVVVLLVVRQAVYHQFDAALVASAGGLGTLLGEEGGAIELEFADEVMPSFEPGPAARFFQVWVEDPGAPGTQRTLERSRSLGDAQLPCRFGTVDAPETWNLELPDGRPGRAAGMQVPVDRLEEEDETGGPDPDPASMPRAIVVVAAGRESPRQTLQATAFGLGLAGVLLALGTAGLVTWSLRRGMKPVVALGRQVEQVDSGRLARRFEPATVPAELRPIVVGLNHLLERLEEAFERERRTTAVISHELRTPIAELLSATEVARKWDDDADLAGETVRTAHDIARHMERIVQTLLRISRLDFGQVTPSRDVVALRPCIEAGLQPFEADAAAKGLHVRLDIAGDVHARTDRDAFALIVGNLLSNAVAHSPEGGAIRCSAEARDSTVTLRFANRSDSIAPEDLPHVADPFWRKDGTVSDAGHAGLGLAMVRAVSGAAGIDVSFDVRDGEFVADVTLPRGHAPAATGRPASARTGDAMIRDS
jgi:signal transduction histidine kinase